MVVVRKHFRGRKTFSPSDVKAFLNYCYWMEDKLDAEGYSRPYNEKVGRVFDVLRELR